MPEAFRTSFTAWTPSKSHPHAPALSLSLELIVAPSKYSEHALPTTSNQTSRIWTPCFRLFLKCSSQQVAPIHQGACRKSSWCKQNIASPFQRSFSARFVKHGCLITRPTETPRPSSPDHWRCGNCHLIIIIIIQPRWATILFLVRHQQRRQGATVSLTRPGWQLGGLSTVNQSSRHHPVRVVVLIWLRKLSKIRAWNIWLPRNFRD